MRRVFLMLSVGLLVQCGRGDKCGGSACDCTAQARGVVGRPLTFDELTLTTSSPCPERLLTSAADVAGAFPNGDAPPGVANADFGVDRIVLAKSNPAVQFAVDDGVRIVIGEEPLCQGAAPSCIAYTMHSTTRNELADQPCPYRGPDPCLAP